MTDEVLDVQCLPYMPLEIERLRKSKSWLRCRRQPELAFYLMNLWMRAWHELPAGSIEDDDDVLADAAMCSPERWAEVRQQVLEGWELRNGRLYHHVVTELATEAFGKLRKNRNRTKSAREALQQSRDGAVTDTATEPVTVPGTEVVTDIVTDPEGKGREYSDTSVSDAPASPIDVRTALFSDGLASLRRQTGKTDNQARALIGKWLKATADDAAKVLTKIRQAEADRVAEAIPWITAALGSDDEYRRLFGRA